jgi:hypothetical protein
MEMEIIALHEMGCRVTIMRVATQEAQKLTWLLLIDKLTLPQCVFCFFFFFLGGAKFRQISTWKIWFRPIQRILSVEKKWNKFARFWNFYFPNRQIFMISSSK